MVDQPLPGWRAQIRHRYTVVAVVFLCWTVAIVARLLFLQVYSYDDLQARAERQQQRIVPAAAKRGDIYDRNGRLLAYSVDADTIYAVPGEIRDPEKAATKICAALIDCDRGERAVILKRLGRTGAFSYVKRQVTPAEARAVAALGLEGIGFTTESKRFYPNRELASHLVGYAGTDNEGLGGIESAFDKVVKGKEGKLLVQTDARGRAFSRLERQPTAGGTVELTIDSQLQYIAERELRAGVREHRADAGTAVILDPNTGEILAMANWPTFNPNIYGESPENARRNRAIQDLYEPGSTFKIVTASAAIEEHLFNPADIIDVSAGLIRIGNRVVDDMNHAGEIRVLVGIAEPDVRVWTNVGDAHIGYFGDADGIAAAKAEILEGAGPATVLVANADDPRVMRYAKDFTGRMVTFGFGESASVRATSVEERGLSGTVATFTAGGEQATVRVPLLGRGNLANVLCAAAVATTLGVPLADIASRAERLTPAKRRGEVRHLRNGVTVVDDSYNSSPAALNKSLEMLSREPVVGRRVAVLGEMLELGDLSTSLHEACGLTAARSGLELLVTVGGAPAAVLARTAVDAGMDAGTVRHVATSAAAADLVAGLIEHGDVVLVKGSRGVRTDLVVDRLVAELG